MIPITYVTSSRFKREECMTFLKVAALSDGRPVRDVFCFDFRDFRPKEVLDVNLVELVRNEVLRAYQHFRIPCIVEHAGLIFSEYSAKSYPGGLTKAMWNALGDDFVKETQSAGRKAVARAAIGYCDGMRVTTYVGDTPGTIAEKPRGSRDFYWDTVFIPETSLAAVEGKTYSEIVSDPSLGLDFKMKNLSQSGKAMLQFLEARLKDDGNRLWRGHRG